MNAATGIFASRKAIPRLLASDSLRPMRASSGSVNRQKGTRRPVVTRSMPPRLSRTTRTSSSPMWVKNGLPAQSPTAHTPGAVVRSRSSTLTKPRSSRSTPAASRPMPSVFGVRPVATRRSEPSITSFAPPRVVCKPHGLAGPPLHALDVRACPDRNPLVLEEFPQRLRGISIFTVDQDVGPLGNRHAAAKALQGLSQLESDIATSQDEEVLRDAVQFEGLDVRHRPRVGKSRDRVD